jgi:hypothetical protein
MPITVNEAIDQLQAQITQRGGFSAGNLLDSILGVAAANSADLQAMLDKLLTKKGVLTAEDEKALQELLARQQAEEKRRRQQRTRNALIIVGVVGAIGTSMYFIFKKRKA